MESNYSNKNNNFQLQKMFYCLGDPFHEYTRECCLGLFRGLSPQKIFTAMSMNASLNHNHNYKKHAENSRSRLNPAVFQDPIWFFRILSFLENSFALVFSEGLLSHSSRHALLPELYGLLAATPEKVQRRADTCRLDISSILSPHRDSQVLSSHDTLIFWDKIYKRYLDSLDKFWSFLHTMPGWAEDLQNPVGANLYGYLACLSPCLLDVLATTPAFQARLSLLQEMLDSPQSSLHFVPLQEITSKSL